MSGYIECQKRPHTGLKGQNHTKRDKGDKRAICSYVPLFFLDTRVGVARICFFVFSKQTSECRFFSLEIVDPGAYRNFFFFLSILSFKC